MKTSFGMKHRPEFEVLDWRHWGGDGSAVSGPATPQLSGPTSESPPDTAPAPQAAKAPGGADDRGHAIGEARQHGGVCRRRNPVVNDQLRGARMPLPSPARTVSCLICSGISRPAPPRACALSARGITRRIRRPKCFASATPSTTATCRPGSIGRLLDPNDPGDPVPEPFLAAARDPKSWRLIAHNYEFERAMLEHILIPRHGFPADPARGAALLDGGGPGECLPGRAGDLGASARASLPEGPRRPTADAADVAPAQAAQGRGQVCPALGLRRREAAAARRVLRSGRSHLARGLAASQAQAADRERAPNPNHRRHYQPAWRSRRSRAGHRRARHGGP